MKINVTLLLLLFTAITNAQNTIFSEKVNLEWEEGVFKNILNQETEVTTYTFEGASFNASTPQIVRYTNSKNISSNGTLTVEIYPIEEREVSITNEASLKKLTEEYVANTDVIQTRNTFTAQWSILPFRIQNNKVYRLEQFDYRVFYTPISKNSSQYRGPRNVTESVLNSGNIYKIALQQTGVYKITGKFLADNFSISNGSISTSNLQIFTNKGGPLSEVVADEREDDVQEIPLLINDGGDGKIDAADEIIFYAEGADAWVFDEENLEYDFNKNPFDVNNYAFIKTNGSNGKRISTVNSVDEVEYISESFDFVQVYEVDNINLLGAYQSTEGTGKNWYGDYFGVTNQRDYSGQFDISNVASPGEAKIEVSLVSRSRSQTYLKVDVAGNSFEDRIYGTSLTDIEADYAKQGIINEEFLINDGASIVVTYDKSNSDDESWLDFIELEYRKKLNNNYSQVRVSDKKSLEYGSAALKLNGSSYQIWNVTDMHNASLVNTAGNNLGYNVNGELQVFHLIKGDNYYSPEAVGQIDNQNIHGIEEAELVIFYHKDFEDAVNKLKNHRESYNGYKVETIEVEQVFNEFSSGRLDPTAIRDFNKMLLERDEDYKYVLLFGDGTYDYRNLSTTLEDHNFVPVYETDESLDPINGFPTDDYYVLLSDTEGGNLRGGLDLAIGRIPVTDATTANAIVDKIIHYDTNKNRFSDWKLRIGFTADDEDNNLHLNQTDNLAELMEDNYPIYNQSKIYLDAYQQVSTPGGDRYTAASDALNSFIQKGGLLLNYLGHGGPKGWAQERVLKTSDIDTWTNYDQLPVLVTATCSFTGYDDPAVLSAGEYAIQKADGGVVALLTTVRAVYASENERLARAVFNTVFQKDAGKALTFGEIITIAKNENADNTYILNDRKFSLIGDPSQPLALPEHTIQITEVNSKATGTLDTISALEEVVLKGNIKDSNGNVLSDFNGVVSLTLYDKESTLETLANDSGSQKRQFGVYRNVLFKGSATVTNGEFSMTFVMPQDINYEFGQGRISMYAYDGQETDAAGYFNEFIVGGTKPGVAEDTEGPEIQLYMNDESFVHGGSVDGSPTLLAVLNDDLGINVSGTSIGHDIVAVLDEDTKNSFILNDYYEANVDDHTSGKVRFPLNDLEPGIHTISLKAWDISNNSAESILEFRVIEEGEDKLRNVYNYPNPFSNNTTFTFEHDLVGSDLDIYVDIYTVSGKLVKTNFYQQYATGYRISNLYWDGRTDFGTKLGKGIYFYKIKIKATELNLSRESDFQKLVIF